VDRVPEVAAAPRALVDVFSDRGSGDVDMARRNRIELWVKPKAALPAKLLSLFARAVVHEPTIAPVVFGRELQDQALSPPLARMIALDFSLRQFYVGHFSLQR
jgi:hypothetical protein